MFNSCSNDLKMAVEHHQNSCGSDKRARNVTPKIHKVLKRYRKVLKNSDGR